MGGGERERLNVDVDFERKSNRLYKVGGRLT